MIEKNIKQHSIKKEKNFEFLNNSPVSGPILLKAQSIEISFLYFVINNFLSFPRHRLNQYLHNYLLPGQGFENQKNDSFRSIEVQTSEEGKIKIKIIIGDKVFFKFHIQKRL